ncbi:hypothetical protein PAXRUDRAFT_783881 [Paxillus rubicundulus Ve08.2h10]|uniref:Uncharacterized protein n=1 Tax=Paxillus rubicundulus Ve08.2h10 TaxID=930991 RepID=A0A0D0E7R7_9AGAM|nr:hypothetical protein PAXRUDRAFT_783881 [Paxillus rubicundulus Ve08.2h10]
MLHHQCHCLALQQGSPVYLTLALPIQPIIFPVLQSLTPQSTVAMLHGKPLTSPDFAFSTLPLLLSMLLSSQIVPASVSDDFLVLFSLPQGSFGAKPHDCKTCC